MINVNIDKPMIPDGADFKHKSTSWQIATTKDFDNDILVESIEDEENLLEYSVLNKLDDDQVVFARVKILFDNDTETEWSRPITLSEHQKGFKLSNTIVVTPRVYVDDAMLDVRTEELTVRTGDFALYAGVGKHEATTWSVETPSGKVIWERLEDKDNLTSITLEEGILKNDAFYVIKARHVSDTNTASNPGRLTISTGMADLTSV